MKEDKGYTLQNNDLGEIVHWEINCEVIFSTEDNDQKMSWVSQLRLCMV